MPPKKKRFYDDDDDEDEDQPADDVVPKDNEKQTDADQPSEQKKKYTLAKITPKKLTGGLKDAKDQLKDNVKQAVG